MSFLVAQLGARMHYAVPRMLHEQGMLEHFYTDICAVKGLPRALKWIPETLRPAPVKRLLGRVPHGVPKARISAFTDFGREYARRRVHSASPAHTTAAHLWAGKTFCERVIERGLGGATGVYTFNSAGLELLRYARSCGLHTVTEQTIAPLQIERALLRAEHAQFPAWQAPLPENEVAEEFVEREKAEWQAANVILCGSEFVRDGIAQCGGPAERCVVVPYGVDARFDVPVRPKHASPLRVLTIGEVGLRKGSPYVFAAAKLLGDRAQFRMVGSVSVQPEVWASLKTRVELTGPVPRSEILAHYAWADVFLLPSLCEGSATVTYEALACGLPVVTTPNSGSIVREGVDGFVVPIRDPESVAAKLESFLRNPGQLEAFSAAARIGAQAGTLAAYARRLHAAIGRFAVNYKEAV